MTKEEKQSSLLAVRPLGGAGEIGHNMVSVKTKKDHVLIDSGILFPSDQCFDLNYLIPDLSPLQEDPPTALIITHGHEDHIGAIAHTIEALPHLEIFAPPFARALIERKLNFLDIKKTIHEYTGEKPLNFLDIDIHPIQVNHSIPDTYGLLITDKKTKYCCFYVSDFKYDPKSPYEPSLNFDNLKALSQSCPTKILMSDSTNILKKGQTTSESELVDDFEKIISKAQGRTFITTFASNIFRFRTILHLANKYNKKVIPYGRSIENYLDIATEQNLLAGEEFALAPVDSVDFEKESEKDLIILVSGCQGDFRGALKRIATGIDPKFKPKAGDTFVFSSKMIPGNEKRIYKIINDLSAYNCQIITPDEAKIHATGHAYQEDLKALYQNYNPTIALPVHGEKVFLQKHQEFIQEFFPQTQALRFYNHDTFLLDQKGAARIESNEEDLPPKIIHGRGIEISSEAIRERRKVATTGVIFLSINQNSLIKKQVIHKIDLFGLPEELTFDENHLKELIKQQILPSNQGEDCEKDLEELRIIIRRICHKAIGYKPVVKIHLV